MASVGLAAPTAIWASARGRAVTWRRAQVGELARQNQALAAHLAEVEAHKGQLAAQVAALRERWQGAAAENLRLTSELAALRKALQARARAGPGRAGATREAVHFELWNGVAWSENWPWSTPASCGQGDSCRAPLARERCAQECRVMGRESAKVALEVNRSTRLEAAQAHMGDAPLPAGEAGGGAAGELAGLPGLPVPPERAPSAPSPAEFFGNIAALTSGSYGGLPASSALADGPDLAGSLALDAPAGATAATLPGGAPGAGGYGLPEPLAAPKAEAWRAFGRLGAAGGGAPGGAPGVGGGARLGGGHQEPSTPEYAEPANGGAARGPFGAVAGNAAGGQGLESWRPGGGAQGWRSLSGTGMGGSGGSGGGGHQQLLEDWRSISGPAAARGGPGLRRARGAQLPPAPQAEELPAPAPPPRMTRTASPAVNTQRGARMASGKRPCAVGRQAAALLGFGDVSDLGA